jgi:hypothetical protein
MERDAAQLLKIADDAEEIARLRIAARANTRIRLFGGAPVASQVSRSRRSR